MDVAHSGWRTSLEAAKASKKPVVAGHTVRELPESESGLSSTHWLLFTVGMAQRGLKDEDIRKILGENVLRVVRPNLSLSRQ